ncbi:MAG: hypothetical protein ACYSSO_07385 [Planctomycetota bacterium]|jgi:hypothetical protein
MKLRLEPVTAIIAALLVFEIYGKSVADIQDHIRTAKPLKPKVEYKVIPNTYKFRKVRPTSELYRFNLPISMWWRKVNMVYDYEPVFLEN